jgi:hypothetical protein
MGWIKKICYGSLATLFVYIAVSFGEIAGVSVFAPGFIGIGGFMLLLAMGPLELIFDTYE